MKIFFLVLSVFTYSFYVDASSIPVGKQVCFLMINGRSAEAAEFSCDGESSPPLEKIHNRSVQENISYYVSQFVSVGYKVVSCHYVISSQSPQYTCLFSK